MAIWGNPGRILALKPKFLPYRISPQPFKKILINFNCVSMHYIKARIHNGQALLYILDNPFSTRGNCTIIFNRLL